MGPGAGFFWDSCILNSADERWSKIWARQTAIPWLELVVVCDIGARAGPANHARASAGRSTCVPENLEEVAGNGGREIRDWLAVAGAVRDHLKARVLA